MARVTLYIAVFLILMNLTAGALAASGAYDDWGIALDPGGDQAVESANATAQDVTATGEGTAQTLFTLFISVTSGLIDAVLLGVAGGPVMLNNMGFPVWLNTLIFGPMYVIIAADVAHLLIGRDTM